MYRERIALTATLMLLCLIAAPLATQAQDDQARSRSSQAYGRGYDIRILDPAAAEAIVRQQCPPETSDVPCRVMGVGPSSLEVVTNAATHAKIAAALAKAQKVPAAQVFQVTMIEAENNGDRGLGNVPEPARAALEDARSFLPFNGYKLLGTAILRTNEGASAMVNGPKGDEYNCEISFYHVVDLDGRQLMIRRFSLSRMPPKRDNGQYVGDASAVDILNTSFGMKPGETVVVGTSRLEGANQALVVLLTALD